jgi:hypothetical protein
VGPGRAWAAPRVGVAGQYSRHYPAAGPPKGCSPSATRPRPDGSAAAAQAREQAAGALAVARIGGQAAAVIGKPPALRAAEEGTDLLQKLHSPELPVVPHAHTVTVGPG